MTYRQGTITLQKGQIYQSFGSGRQEMYVILTSSNLSSRILCARVHDKDIAKELEDKGTWLDDVIVFEDHNEELYSIDMEDIALRDLSNFMYLAMVTDDILFDINEALKSFLELK